MATVTDILKIAAKLSGLRADDAESDVALMALNKAYLRACLDCELSADDASYTVTAATGNLAATAISGYKVMRVQHVRIQSQNQNLPIQQVSRQELQDHLAVSNGDNSTPEMYSVAIVGNNVRLDFYPQLSAGDVVHMSYLAKPNDLTAFSTEPSYIPDMFHHDILTNAVVAALLERDGNLEKAGTYIARSLEGMTRLEEYLGQMGGTANRSYIAPVAGRGRFPDQR